jgi:DNA ligase (NAD+)
MTVQELKRKLIKANKEYRLGNPIMTDDEYDELLNELKEKINENEYKEFRETLLENPGKFKHTYKVGSLRKIKYEEFDDNEIKFIGKNFEQETQLIISAKIDGNSIVLYYDENGILENVVTRGNGIYGEIRNNLKPIFPQKINIPNAIIRGELFTTFTYFEDIKKEFKQYENAKNPRNLVAGLIHRDELDKKLLDKLVFMAFEIMGSNDTQDIQLDKLQKNEFIIPSIMFEDVQYITKEILKDIYLDWKEKLNYPIDGLVLNSVGYTFENALIPTYRIAFKVNTEVAKSVIKNIHWNVSKNGKLTPVAIIEPVELNGTKVSRITLYNARNVELSKIGIGSKVLVYKAGEIIPAIKEVLSEEKVELPETCPICGSKLEYDGTELYCKNDECSVKIMKKLVDFLKRLGIKGFTEKSLLNFGITSFEKLIKFNPDNGYKNQVKLRKELDNKLKNMTEEEIFKAYPFENLGDNLLSRIINHYGFENIKTMKCKELEQLGFPELVSFITFETFLSQRKKAFKLLDLIKEHYGEIKIKKEVKNDKILKGKSFCITGSFENFKRKELEEKIKEMGGEIKGVSKNLDFLIIGKNPGSKEEKAKKLDIYRWYFPSDIELNEMVKMIKDSDKILK